MQPAVLDVFRPPAQNSARRTYKRGITPHPYKPHDGISRRNRPIHKMTLYKSSPNFKPRIAIRLAASLPSFDLRRINIRTRQETMMVVVPHWTEIVLSVYTQKAKKMYEVLRMLCDLQHKTNWGVEVYFLAVSVSALDDGEGSVSFTSQFLYYWGQSCLGITNDENAVKCHEWSQLLSSHWTDSYPDSHIIFNACGSQVYWRRRKNTQFFFLRDSISTHLTLIYFVITPALHSRGLNSFNITRLFLSQMLIYNGNRTRLRNPH